MKDLTLYESLEQGVSHILQESDLAALAKRSYRVTANLNAGLKSCLFVPMRFGNRITGAMFFWSVKDAVYGEHHLALAEQVTEQIAGVIANEWSRRNLENANSSLKASEENYRDLVESSHDLIWRCDAEGRFTYLNPAWEESLGYSAFEMLGRPFSDFQTPEWAKRDSEEFAQNLTGTPAVNYETQYIAKSEREITLLFSALAVMDDDGNVTGAKGVARDITNERMVQESLQASEENYRDLVESSYDLIWRCDPEGRFTYVNPAWERTLHYTADEMLGRRFTDFQTQERGERDIAEFTKDLVGPAAEDFETRYKTKSGEDVTLVFNALHVKDSDGVVIGAKGTARNITRQKTAEEELRIRLAALDVAADMVVITDSRGNIEYVNEAFAKYTGYTRDEAIGANPRLVKSGRQGEDFYRDLWETIVAGNVWSSTLINRRKDGSEYPEEMTITPVIGDDGEVLRFIAIKRDISGRLKIAAEREAARDLETEHRELQRVNEARSEFLSTVSHELRTPLTTMLAFSDILHRNRDRNLTDRQIEHLALISRNGHRLNELIDDLLDVSRSETGRFQLEFAPFDMRELIEEVVSSCGSVFDDRGQVLKVVNLPSLTRVDGDRARITQVLNNLLTNAAKYSPDGSTAELIASIEEDVVTVEVRDQGIGISQEDQQRLFVPFFRATNTETRKESGTGLGLVIVKTIIELHGGSVELESQQNEGTHVRVGIPGILTSPVG